MTSFVSLQNISLTFVFRTVQTAAYYIQKYYHHCHHEWTFIKRISFKNNAVKEKGFLQYRFRRFFRQTEQFWRDHNNLVSKVRKSRNQFMTPSILQKNERKKKKWPLGPLGQILFRFLFVFWKNWEHHNLLSRFSDLYNIHSQFCF